MCEKGCLATDQGTAEREFCTLVWRISRVSAGDQNIFGSIPPTSVGVAVLIAVSCAQAKCENG